MKTYQYTVNRTSNGIKLSLTDLAGHQVWGAVYPSFVQLPDGEMDPDFSPVELGAMKNFADVDGLRSYLSQLNIIKPDSIIKS